MERPNATTYAKVNGEVADAILTSPVIDGVGTQARFPLWWANRGQALYAATVLDIPSPRVIIYMKLICIANMIQRSYGIDYHPSDTD